ncbi:hypothetical protein COS81_02395 [candidate division WWE3 bacterium CG06_land_8_20_14_3_00_42_16]|uniref:DUF458 domain-containing protein n=4 Tax=Katanobacteria TaxID=422282 RepID=A0A2M7ANA0_UNCKA|nr:MAG: hypothetical protein COS81_02395 [candidate division WWE3 bacterium CG06_land_8_20_14_3_00_42_16]PIZ41730.1 MAG: hypothetical protein COY34_03995 [candidate division WWE3 bacterium CG_4_10_14_0_2_um_filter_42_8]PJA37394.1 MAG: hypothetical protein CO181_03695 [candidate division WWE3 bacterium CG_4_9_14_3_um_filter_43_9]PJC68463.1 MAG: hypothetical protein CO015_03845 [candidate division WWE3 bacterium CG_4_8_14_3_um_filter_42_11]
MDKFSYIRNQDFISPTKGKMGLDRVLSEIKKFIDEKPDIFYRLVIGSDSHLRRYQGKTIADFVTAIVIHRQGLGGRYFWLKIPQDQTYSLRAKIYTETIISLELAQKLVPKLKSLLDGENYALEIHIDVGESGPTREMIKEVVGMVNGNGFPAKTKPESFGAFVVADRHT